jgi:hypothetical protein
MEENTVEQAENSKVAHLQPYQYKKGQSGNPLGRSLAKGESLKEYAKRKLAGMTPEEKEEYFNGIDKRIIWEMAEGKAKQDIEQEVKGTLTIEISEAIAKKNGIKP